MTNRVRIEGLFNMTKFTIDRQFHSTVDSSDDHTTGQKCHVSLEGHDMEQSKNILCHR